MNKTGNVHINITLRCVCITTGTRKSNKYYILWVYVWNLRYLAWHVHVLCYNIICGLSVSTKFSHVILQMMIFRKKLWNIKCVIWFSLLTLLWNISHSKKNSARYCHKCIYIYIYIYIYVQDTVINVYMSSCEVPVILPDFNENWSFCKDFQKIIKYQIS